MKPGPKKGSTQTPAHVEARAKALRKPTPEEKRCPRCKLTKPVEDFKTRPNQRTLNSYCIPCHRDYAREYVARHPRKAGARRQSNRAAQLKRKYGMTIAEYDALLESQDGVCAICKVAEPGREHTYLPVDHCHKTGAVRGLLCHRCNRALGLLRDDADILQAAIDYLTSK